MRIISLETLKRLGYRIVHASNIGKATVVLKKLRDGKPVLHNEIDAAISSLDFSPLTQDEHLQLNEQAKTVTISE